MRAKPVKHWLAHSRYSVYPLGLGQNNVISNKQDSPRLYRVLHRQKSYVQVTVLASIRLLPLLETLCPGLDPTAAEDDQDCLCIQNPLWIPLQKRYHLCTLLPRVIHCSWWKGRVRKPTGHHWDNNQVTTPPTTTSLGDTNTPMLL